MGQEVNIFPYRQSLELIKHDKSKKSVSMELSAHHHASPIMNKKHREQESPEDGSHHSPVAPIKMNNEDYNLQKYLLVSESYCFCFSSDLVLCITFRIHIRWNENVPLIIFYFTALRKGYTKLGIKQCSEVC